MQVMRGKELYSHGHIVCKLCEGRSYIAMDLLYASYVREGVT